MSGSRMKAVLVAFGLLAMAGTAIAQGDVIAERRAGLKRMGGHMEAMKPVVDAKGDVRALEPRIDDMIAWYARLPALFPAGSGTGDTKALPALWERFGEFEANDAKLVDKLKTMKVAAAAGDTEAFGASYKALGPEYCGSCHRPFRAR
jgi:cytochrome c556